jgi:uncharacterized protein (TIGR02001 family)
VIYLATNKRVVAVKKQVLCVAMMATMFAGTSQAVEVTGNVGIVSEYVFRGIPSSDGKAAAQGGIDADFGNGFSIGTWASTVDFREAGPEYSDGVEIDLYGGYGGEIGDFGYSIGATYYTYTEDADDDYIELNLGASWKWFAVDVAIGEYDNFAGETLEYTFVSGTAEYNGLYVTVGDFSDDFSGTYYEVGYGSTVTAGGEDLFDYTISYIDSDDDLLIGTDSNSRLVFGFVKNFGIVE